MNESKRTRISAALVVSLILSLIFLVGLFFAVRKLTVTTSDLAVARTRINTMEEDHLAQLAAVEENFQEEIRRVNENWSQELARQKEDQQDKLARIYENINQIVYDSGDTLKYIDSLEAKLERGLTLAEEDVASLEMIAAGLAYLRTQYRKPIHEFKELELFLASQLNVESMEHNSRFRFFKRMFSKDYREAEREYYKDVGKREAFTAARDKVAAAYIKAQSRMAAISSSHDKYLRNLHTIITKNENHAEELSAFFSSSREVINIHQSVMQLEDELMEPAAPDAPPAAIKP